MDVSADADAPDVLKHTLLLQVWHALPASSSNCAPTSTLRNLEIEDITSKDVYDAAIAGDKLAKEIFEYTGKILGEAFADFIAFSSPQAIILFGGLSKSGDLLLKPLREAMDKSVMSIFRGKTQVILSELKESDAAVLGASALGWEAKYRADVAPSSAPVLPAPAPAIEK